MAEYFKPGSFGLPDGEYQVIEVIGDYIIYKHPDKKEILLYPAENSPANLIITKEGLERFLQELE